jgi:NAD(P)-dependent dehydrogenase (short-subunit alcohol dehydrogenase family)
MSTPTVKPPAATEPAAPAAPVTRTVPSRSSDTKVAPSPAVPEQKSALATRLPNLPDFSLRGKTIIVSGGAGGLGIVQSEALLEAGATVYILDRLPAAPPPVVSLAAKARELWNTVLAYRTADVTDQEGTWAVVDKIAEEHGRIDGCIAAAGVQQETPAIEYKAEDANRLFSVNITGVMVAAQAAARSMLKDGKGGSIVLIASMSGTVANRVCSPQTHER